MKLKKINKDKNATYITLCVYLKKSKTSNLHLKMYITVFAFAWRLFLFKFNRALVI